MSSEFDNRFQESLTDDENAFFDFGKYYGEGSHPDDDDIDMSEAHTEEHHPVSQLGGPGPSQPQRAPLGLGLHDNVQKGLEEQPVSLLFRGQGLGCPAESCRANKRFSRNADLRRHMQTVHGTTSYPCPHDTCPRTFNRKDKLNQHIREKHDTGSLIQCQRAHCVTEISYLQQHSHTQEHHGIYECALGLCQNAGSSHFLQLKLKKHLRDHHDISRGVCDKVMETLSNSGETTVRPEHVPTGKKMKSGGDCSACLALSVQTPVFNDLGTIGAEAQVFNWDGEVQF